MLVPTRRATGWCVTVLLLCGWAAGAVADAPAVELELFTRRGCPRCAAAERFLEVLEREQPGLRIIRRDIEQDPLALRRLGALAAARQAAVVGVPAFAVGDALLIGFVSPESTGPRLRALVAGSAGNAEGGDAVCPAGPASGCAGADEIERVSLPGVGSLSPGEVGLPLFTIALGLLDGFNPCAMWVLLFLLSLLVNVHDRRRMLAIAGTFVLASGAVYFAFMAAWLNVFLLIGFSTTVRAVIALVALAVGAVNVKDAFWAGRGISFSIPAAAKPRIYAGARRVLHAESLLGAMAAVLVLALLVNTVELLCTAGLPAVFTHVLTQQALSAPAYYAYLGLYNAAYVLDDGLMVFAAVLTLQRFKLQERGGRWLKLLSGLVLLALGLTLLFRPDWLAFGAR
jgi:hypothetical protein